MAKPILSDVKVKTIIRDLGWNRIKRQIVLMNGSNTEVGLPKDGQTSGRYTMSKLIQVADDNEFGKTVPERSFIRSAVDENRLKINEMVDKGADAIIAGIATVDQVLSKIGKSVQTMVVNKIIAGPFTPLSPVTIAKKGHAVPLFETGQLMMSIQHKERIKASIV